MVYIFPYISVPPPRSSSRINESAQKLMLLSSLTAAALESARSVRNAAAAAASGHNSVSRSTSIPASASDIQQIILAQEQQGRPKSTPPLNNALIDATLDRITAEERALTAANQSNTSLSSMDSQNGIINRSRQQILEERHQELLNKQKMLQEQYSKLQMLSRGQIPQGLLNDLKKTGSESNIISRSGFLAPGSGSLTQLIPSPKERTSKQRNVNGSSPSSHVNGKVSPSKTLTQKIYETDIL